MDGKNDERGGLVRGHRKSRHFVDDALYAVWFEEVWKKHLS